MRLLFEGGRLEFQEIAFEAFQPETFKSFWVTFEFIWTHCQKATQMLQRSAPELHLVTVLELLVDCITVQGVKKTPPLTVYY